MSKNDKRPRHSRALNALSHGLYAKDVLLPWDLREDFAKLHDDLKIEFFPQGRAEEEAVLDLAMLHWQKRTLWRMRQTVVLKDPFTFDILQTGAKSWSGVRKGLREAAGAAGTLLGDANDSMARFSARIERLEKKLDNASEIDEIKSLQEKIDACYRVIREHVAPLLHQLIQGPNAEEAFDKAYAPESMEKIIRLEATLDARIAKVFVKDGRLEEFKRTPAGTARDRLIEALPPL